MTKLVILGRKSQTGNYETFFSKLPARTVTTLVAARIPVIGICKGMQVINVAFGGTILQDMSGDSLHSIPSGDAFHTSIMTEDSRLFKYFPVKMHVNSAHHQRIDRLGQHLKIIQRCPDDGCPEALEHDELPILGLQWLPEQAGEPLLSLLSSYF